MPAEDLKADSWSGNHPAAPEGETDTRRDFPSAYLRDGMVGGENASSAASSEK